MTQTTDNLSDERRIGDVLRETREQRQVTLSDVSKELLIREDYLNAIETMYAGGVPKGYLNGILRTYAGYLNMDAEHVIATFNRQCGAVSEAPKMEAVVAANERSRSVARAAFAGFAGALLLALVGGIGFVMIQNMGEEEIIEAGTPVNGARTSLFAEADAPHLEPQLPLTLTAQRPAWVEVRGSDGTVFRSRTMAAGEVYYPRIGAGWTVSARDGSAFVWHVGDVEIGPLADTAAAVYAISIDTIAQDARNIAAPALAATSDGQPSQ